MRYISASLAVAALAVSPAISAPLPQENSVDARDLIKDFGYIYARGAQATKEVAAKAGTVVKNTAEAFGQGALKDKINSMANPPVDPPQGLKDAAKAATSPHNPAVVNAFSSSNTQQGLKDASKASASALTGKKRELNARNHGLSERDIIDILAREYVKNVYKREYNRDLYARGAQISKEVASKAATVAKNTAEALGQSAVKDKINSMANPPVEAPQGLKDAAKAATSPHSPALINAFSSSNTQQGLKDAAKATTEAMTANHSTGKKRELNKRNLNLSNKNIVEVLTREYVKNVYKRELYDMEERGMSSLEELD